MEIQEITGLLNSNLHELTLLLLSIRTDKINIVPFKGSWTAGQVVNHIIKFSSGFDQVLNGQVEETNRKPEEKIEMIKTDFLNFSTKMNAPEFVVPEKINYKKEDLLIKLKDINLSLIKSIQSLDMTSTCISFELPVYGRLTRLEAVFFVIYHTRRHIHQLKRIIAVLNRKQIT